jgi:hypothetical protein
VFIQATNNLQVSHTEALNCLSVVEQCNVIWLFYIHLHVITSQIGWKLKPKREREREREDATELELRSVSMYELQRIHKSIYELVNLFCPIQAFSQKH